MDAVASSVRYMDVAYERCVKKIGIYSDKKRIGASFFWFCFLCSYKENELADREKSLSINIKQTGRAQTKYTQMLSTNVNIKKAG